MYTIHQLKGETLEKALCRNSILTVLLSLRRYMVFPKRNSEEENKMTKEKKENVIDEQVIKIDLGFAVLVAGKSTDPLFPEFYVGLEDHDGCYFQDIAVIGQKYHVNNNDCVPTYEDNISVRIWSDKDSEDYTHTFDIEPYEQECIRPLRKSDLKEVEVLDNHSGNYVSQWLEDNEDYAWGYFKEGSLIGYCTVGYADDVCSTISQYPGYSPDSMILSDVFIVDDMRHKGYGHKMVNEVLKRRVREENDLVFLRVLYDSLSNFYEDFGFKMLEDGYMVRSNSEVLFEGVKKQLEGEDNTTDYGEPQGFIYLANGRSIEITLEKEGLSEEDFYYSGRLHCTEEEFANDDFHSTMGVIDMHVTSNADIDEVKGLIKVLLACNKHNPVKNEP